MNDQTSEIHAQAADVSSVNAVINAMYESVSFAPGRQPNYTRLRTLFHPQATVAPPRAEHDAEIFIQSVDAFITQSRGYIISTGLEREGFFEREVARKSNVFGSITQIFSTYESRHRPGDPVPFQRGINSIQLGKDGKRWWILSILWDVERSGNPIPAEYLS